MGIQTNPDSSPTIEDYVLAVWRGRRIVVGWAVGLSVFALVVSLILPPTYEASSIVLLLDPSFTIELDDRLTTTDNRTEPQNLQTLSRSFVPIALSDDVLGAVYDDFPDSFDNLAELREAVQALQVEESNVIYLTVQADDPVLVQELANVWAGVLEQQMNTLYLFSPSARERLESQLAAVRANLESAESDYTAFKQQDDRETLNADLSMLNEQYRRTLRLDARNTLLLETLDMLEQGLQGLPTDDRAAPMDALLVTTVQLQIAGTADELRTGDALPSVQLQAGDFAGPTNSELLERLSRLRVYLNDQLQTTTQTRDQLSQDIFELQGEIAEVEEQSYLVNQARDEARNAFDVLSVKLTETTTTAEFTSRRVSIASFARPPQEPIAPLTLINILIGGVTGFFFGLSHVYFGNYF